MTPAQVYLDDTLLERLASDLERMTAALGEFIPPQDAVVGPRHVARHRHVAAADPSHVRHGVMGGRNGRVVTRAVRSPARQATSWMHVVSRASAKVMAGSMVVRRLASNDLPALRRSEREGLLR